jgi:hypothetical protein
MAPGFEKHTCVVLMPQCKYIFFAELYYALCKRKPSFMALEDVVLDVVKS